MTTDLLLAGRAARPAPRCPRCYGPLFNDDPDLAPLKCLHCSRPFDASLELLTRPPTELEMSRKHRYSVSRSERR